jgi:Arc/MetJ-type ribon-helix-helix transcriptional regulator
MVVGMAASQKVTITLPVVTIDRVRRLVEAGQTPSISGFVQHAVGVALDDVAGWDSALSEALVSTGGELSAQERAWADSVLNHEQQTGAA